MLPRVMAEVPEGTPSLTSMLLASHTTRPKAMPKVKVRGGHVRRVGVQDHCSKVKVRASS